MADEEDYEGWRKLGVPRGMVDEYKANPDRPFRMEDPPDELVERTVHEMCEAGRKRRERVQFLRELHLSDAFIEDILRLEESSVNHEPMTDEKFQEIMRGFWEKYDERDKFHAENGYTEEEIAKIESHGGSRKILEDHNKKVLRRKAREAYWRAVKYWLSTHPNEITLIAYFLIVVAILLYQ